MYVCICKAITDDEIRDAVNNGAQSIAALSKSCGVGTQCGQCKNMAEELIASELEKVGNYAA